jgi:hypothetical protein
MKNGLIILCGGLAEIDRSSNSFSKRCRELTNIELSEATKLEKATLAVENRKQ